MPKGNYKIFFTMLAISFIIMYAVMFLNVAALNHVYLSLTRFYMAILMVAPMAVVMLALMWKMYQNTKLNIAILIGSTAIFILALIGLRTQTPIGDVQFMKAMIPHHSSAILTSENANITDPEVKALSEAIIETQVREINQMKEILKRMD